MTDFFNSDTYILLLLTAGFLALAAAFVPVLLKGKIIPAPVVYTLIGAAVFFALPDFNEDPFDHPTEIAHITEFVILVALANAGIRIKEPFAWRTWKKAFRLLVIAMPVTIAAAALLGNWIIGFSIPTAILLGGLIAPTDPVLASELQTSDPGEPDKSKTKLGLTAEAGINDGIAFPFIYLAIYWLTEGADYGDWIGKWFWYEFLYKIGTGIGIGLLAGYGLCQLSLWIGRDKEPLNEISRGILSVALLLLPFSLAEIVHGYGFLSVFFAACVFSNSEKNLSHAVNLHDLNEELERFVVALIFVSMGFFIALRYDTMLDWRIISVAVLLVFIVRPIAGYVSLIGTNLNRFQRFVLAFYGIRGIGSLFYLTFALSEAAFPMRRELIAVTIATIFLSILVHGASARWVQKHIKRHDWQD